MAGAPRTRPPSGRTAQSGRVRSSADTRGYRRRSQGAPAASGTSRRGAGATSWSWTARRPTTSHGRPRKRGHAPGFDPRRRMRDTYTVRQTAQLKLFADLAGEPWQQGNLVDKGRHRVHALADRARRAKVHHRRADEETLVVARAQSARLARFTAAIGAPLPLFRDGGGAQAGELLLEAVRRMALAYVLPGVGRCTRIRWLVTACAGGSRSGVAGSPQARPIGPRRDVRIGGRRCLQPLALASLAGFRQPWRQPSPLRTIWTHMSRCGGSGRPKSCSASATRTTHGSRWCGMRSAITQPPSWATADSQPAAGRLPSRSPRTSRSRRGRETGSCLPARGPAR
jgi:hypothetical protein